MRHELGVWGGPPILLTSDLGTSRRHPAFSTMLAVLAQAAAMLLTLTLARVLSVSHERDHASGRFVHRRTLRVELTQRHSMATPSRPWT